MKKRLSNFFQKIKISKIIIDLDAILLESVIRLGEDAGHGPEQSVAEALDPGEQVPPAGLGAGLDLFPPVLVVPVHVQNPQAIRQRPHNLANKPYSYLSHTLKLSPLNSHNFFSRQTCNSS